MIYSIKGTIVNNQDQSPIKGANISITPTNSVFTDTNGSFTISGNIPESGSLSLTIKATGYQAITQSPYKGDNTLKDNIGVIQLQPIQQSLTQDKIKSSQLSRAQIKELSKDKKNLSYYAEEKLSNQVNTLKNTLIPAILTMAASFGVTQLGKYTKDQLPKILEQSTCPTQPELINLINRKNKLVKQLSNSLKLIDATTKALGITESIIIPPLQALLTIADTNPPITNPIPSGVSKTLDRTIATLSSVNVGILSILIILRQVLIQAIDLLNLLDNLIQHCYPEAQQDQISTELTALTIQQSTQLSPVVTNINGFEMGVVTEPTTNSLKRRRAIARNKQGVVMLQGEWSFSSIDQILIDELVFYIQQNNLKAD
jgi:hypothetical protein